MRSTSLALGRLTGIYAHGYEPKSVRFTPRRAGSAIPIALFSGRIIPRALTTLTQATRPASGIDYQSYGLGLEGCRYVSALYCEG